MDNPEYIGLPRTGTKCPRSGLSRSGIYNLIRPTKANGYKVVVASRVVCLPGRSRGRRLVHLGSLMKYLGAGVVPVERQNLQRLWTTFRATCRRTRKASGPVDSPLVHPDDLPEDAQFYGQPTR